MRIGSGVASFAALISLIFLPSAWAQSVSEGGSGSSSGNGSSGEAGGEEKFYRVYGYELPLAGWAELNLWDNAVTSSRQPYDHFGKEGTRQGVTSHSLELEYGVAERFALGGYLDFENPKDGSLQVTGGRLLARYIIDNKYEHFFDTGLYAEYYFPRGAYQAPQQLETRVILEHDYNDLRLDLNPILSISTTGEESHQNPSLSDAIGLYYRRRFAFQPGIELYDDWGPIGKMPSLKQQQHVLFPTATIQFGHVFTWNLGVGFGLTSGSDRVTLKSIFTYEFNAFRPSQLFGRRSKSVETSTIR